MAYVITGIVVVISTLGYSIPVSAMPRPGGGYVAISRILNPFAAFIGSWYQFFVVTTDFGIIAVLVFEEALGSPWGVGPALGVTPVVAGYYDIGYLAEGLLLVVLFTAIVLPSSLIKVNGRFNSPVYATILVGIVAVLGSLAETCILCSGGSWYLSGPVGNFLGPFFYDGVSNFQLPRQGPFSGSLWFAGVPPIVTAFVIVGNSFFVIMPGYSTLISNFCIICNMFI